MKMSSHIKTFVMLLSFFSCLFTFPVHFYADDTGTLAEGSVLNLSMEEGILMVLKRNLDIAVLQIELRKAVSGLQICNCIFASLTPL